MAGKPMMKKLQGLKEHKKAKKEKAIAKRAATTDRVKKAIMIEEKVELAQIQEEIQHDTANHVARGGIIFVFTLVDAREEEFNDIEFGIKQGLPALTPVEKPAASAKREWEDGMLFANLETPQQRFNRICYIACASTEMIVPWDDECEPESIKAAACAVDESNLERVGLRSKDAIHHTVDPPSFIDQLFSMVANNGHSIVGISSGAKVSQCLETIEKHIVLIPNHPFLIIVEEEDTVSIFLFSGITTDGDSCDQHIWSVVGEERDLFSRSVTPFSDTVKKETPVVRLPSRTGSSPVAAARSLAFFKATSTSIYNSIIGLPTREQIKAALVFSYPDETVETAVADAVAAIPPAIVSFREKRQCDDIVFTRKLATLSSTFAEISSQTPASSSPCESSLATD
ncbi:hypothetical protein DE146DRAFT_773180 [Phaeosphaeria sp. MPI-PUGE-AT-0046c]|nr:hypothetical protein DE146DRAFT_773180 [Phaeosphaeria sp. MPI-PUGE-AT-0046c]